MKKLLISAIAFVALAFAAPCTSWAQQVLKVGTTTVRGEVEFPQAAIQAVAKDAGLQIEIQTMAFGELLPSLTAKKIDIIANDVSPTPERAKVVDFSQNYASFRDALIVPTADERTYKAVADFAGLTIATVKGTLYVAALQKAGATVLVFDANPAIIAEVEAGRAAGAVTGEPTAVLALKDNTDPKLKIVDTYSPIFASNVAFAVQKGNADLLAKLNASLTKLKADGTIKRIATNTGYNYP